MLNTLVSSKPTVLALSIFEFSGQRNNAFELCTLALILKILLACAVSLIAALVVIASMALALSAIVTKLSCDSLNEKSVI